MQPGIPIEVLEDSEDDVVLNDGESEDENRGVLASFRFAQTSFSGRASGKPFSVYLFILYLLLSHSQLLKLINLSKSKASSSILSPF